MKALAFPFDEECPHGVPVATLSRYVRGQRKLSAEVAAKISASTGGEVTICDLLYPEGAPENARLM